MYTTISIARGYITIEPCYCYAFEEAHQKDDPTSGIVVKQLEHVHATLNVEKKESIGEYM